MMTLNMTPEAVREQTGVKAFLLKPFKPLFREILTPTAAAVQMANVL